MTASGGSARRLAAELAQLEREGAPELAGEIRALVQAGLMSVASALEAIEAGETFAKANVAGDISDEQVHGLISQMAVAHVTGRRG